MRIMITTTMPATHTERMVAAVAAWLGMSASATVAPAAPGAGCFERGPSFQAKIADCTRYVESDNVPKNVRALALFERGIARRIAKDTDRAMADFSGAIRLDPGLADAWNGRGMLLQELDDHEAAIADFDVALRLQPRSWIVFNNRGVSWQATGNTSRALEDFNEALALNPRYAMALANRGAVWRSLGDATRARQDLDTALRLDPDLGMAYFNRGVLEFGIRNIEQAVEDFVAAAERLRTLDAELWLFIAQGAAGRNGSHRLSAAARHEPSDRWPVPVARHLLGRMDLPELIQLAGAGTDAKGRLCEARFFAAERLLAMGDRTAALPLLRDATRECPPGFVERDQAALELHRILPVRSRRP